MTTTTGLTEQDLTMLEHESWIDQATAEAFGVFRVTSPEGAEVVGRTDHADYRGLVFPALWPGDPHPREYYLRVDHPDYEMRHGVEKPTHRYFAPPGRKNLLLFGPEASADVVDDVTLPIVFVEGHKKLLAAWRLARWQTDRLRFLACGITGVWNFKTTIGHTTDAQGARVALKGVLPDLKRVRWTDRLVWLLFDSDSLTNPSVRAAREALADELHTQGAHVIVMYLPALDGLEKTGVDDLLAHWGPAQVLDWLADGQREAAAVSEADESSEEAALDLPVFPASAYVGICDEIATLYAAYLEPPKEFFYLDALTFLGALIGNSVRLDSSLREEPRLYTVKVARSGLDRKSSSQDFLEAFFAPLLLDRSIGVCYGAGSAEGLQKIMEKQANTLLVYDEFRAFVDKATVQQSVLLPMVASLFHRTKYENCTKHSEIKLDDAHLSLMAACTTDTFLTMFSPAFRNIGMLNRIFIVTGTRGPRKPMPDPLPERICALQTRVRQLVERVARDRPAIRLDGPASARWTEWYHACSESPHAVRLDAYGLRLMMLFAVSTGTGVISRPLVDAVLDVLAYQFTVRQELDPVDAESVVARMERLVLRQLKTKGALFESRVQKLVNMKYYGLWVYDTACKNLLAHDWIRKSRVGKGVRLSLTESGKEAADA